MDGHVTKLQVHSMVNMLRNHNCSDFQNMFQDIITIFASVVFNVSSFSYTMELAEINFFILPNTKQENSCVKKNKSNYHQQCICTIRNLRFPYISSCHTFPISFKFVSFKNNRKNKMFVFLFYCTSL